MTTARLGNYSIIEPLDKGGMGAVYVAQRDGSPDICVLKQILPDLVDHPTVGLRFRREAQLTALVGMNHPNVPRLMDAGLLEDGSFYMALEFVEGVDLEKLWHHLVKDARMVPYQLTAVAAIDALAGLDHLQNLKSPDGRPLNLVHRDLSGRNIMVNVDGVAKVIDFGVAHADVGDFRTTPGHVLGTPRYFSPETIFGETVQASDQYSLAVLIIELLAGQAIVPSGKIQEVAKFILEEPMPLLAKLNPAVTDDRPAIDAVLQKALSKEAKDRFASCAEFRLALVEAIGDWADTPRHKLGEFLKQWYPDPFARVAEWKAKAKEGFVDAGYTDESTAARRISMPTQTGMAPGVLEIDHALSQEENTVIPVDLTKPGVMRPEASVVTPGPLSERDLETNLVERDRPTAANRTRTAMMLEVPDTQVVMPAGTLSDPAEAIGRAPRKRSNITWLVAGMGGIALAAMVFAVATSGTRQGAQVQPESAVAEAVVEPQAQALGVVQGKQLAEPPPEATKAEEEPPPALVGPKKVKATKADAAKPDAARALPAKALDTEPKLKIAKPASRSARYASLRREAARWDDMSDADRTKLLDDVAKLADDVGAKNIRARLPGVRNGVVLNSVLDQIAKKGNL